MMLRKLLVLAIVAAAPAAVADVLLIEGVKQAEQTASSRPTRGMTMARVESAFGSPRQQAAPVGDPPITRWDYADFVVYFEHDRVIHAVVRR